MKSIDEMPPDPLTAFRVKAALVTPHDALECRSLLVLPLPSSFWLYNDYDSMIIMIDFCWSP